MGSKNLDVTCPCCETKLKVDLKTGEVVWEEKKEKVVLSLADMVKGLDEHKKEAENLFKKKSEAQKERDRLLEEKFQQAQKNVDRSDDSRPLRDFDFD